MQRFSKFFSEQALSFDQKQMSEACNSYLKLCNILTYKDIDLCTIKIFMKMNPFKIAITTLLLFMWNANFGQAPDLGTASTYSVFTKIGAFTNTGASEINGNIGTHAGALSGFPPGFVNGETHVADAFTLQAGSDVETAYSYLAAMSCGSTIGTGLGNGQLLTSNVYCLNTAATLSGELILDAQGDANALFIFKIEGAFLIDPSATILLLNSASSANVYWQINGEFSLGANSVFKGTVLNTGEINMLTGSSLEGRALSRQGAINIYGVQTAISNETPLSIELISLTARFSQQTVLLKWSTASESNNDYYTLERSNDGIEWLIIGKIDGAGNSIGILNYNFSDVNPTQPVSYYRLQQTDFDGNSTVSKTIFVNTKDIDLNDLTIFPNPSNGVFELQFNNDYELVNGLMIVDATGKKVYSSENFQTTIDLSNQNNGMYFLRYKLASGLLEKRLIISK